MNKYDTSFYGSPLWDLYGNSAKKLYTTWNIAIRKLSNLPYRTHVRFLDLLADIHHIKVSLKIRFLKFIKILHCSKSNLVQNVLSYALNTNISPTGLNLARIFNEFDINKCDKSKCHESNLSSQVMSKYINMCTLSTEESAHCMLVKEMIDCKNGIYECGFDNDQCKYLIDFVCTL